MGECKVEFIKVSGGSLAMGSTMEEVDRCVDEWRHHLIEPSYVPVFRSWIMKEYPQHQVEIQPFVAWRYPVTNGQLRAYIEECALLPPESIREELPDDHPAWGVSISMAKGFARWRSTQDGRSWRLPSESEWEWMAAGPEGRRYPFGDYYDLSCLNTVERKIGCTTAVDAHPQGASWCGILDLAGNVEEWTDSYYAPYPGGFFVYDDLIRLVGENYPILRGGSFELGGDLARSARRHGPHPGHPFRITGFRLVEDTVANENSL
jgi:formylglycine-generating enzyme required for sulfatase activity